MEITTYTVAKRGVGLPDYSAPAPVGQVSKPTTYTLTDMGELAARLESVNTFDRRGDVILIDGFEGTLDWLEQPAGGTGSSIVRSALKARHGACSCRMVGGSDGNRRAWMIRRLPFPVLGRMGFEISFTPSTVLTDLSRILIVFGIVSAARESQWALDLNRVGDYFAYQTSLGTWERLGDYGLAVGFNTAKVVGDTANLTYTRAIINEQQWNLDGIPVRSLPGGDVPYMYIYVLVNSVLGTNPEVFVDDAIATMNEPPNY